MSALSINRLSIPALEIAKLIAPKKINSFFILNNLQIFEKKKIVSIKKMH